MADVFISYHEESAGELVAQIAAALKAAGISCWYAKRDIPPGGKFADYIAKEIPVCKIFLLILNEESNKSEHVHREVGLALQCRKHNEQMMLLPFKIDNCGLSDFMRYSLNGLNPMYGIPPDTAHIRTLVEQICRILKKEPPPPAPSEKTLRLTVLSVLSLLTAMIALCVALTPRLSRRDNQWDGHIYRIFDNSCNWKEAQRRCETLNGHLVTITSQQEQDFIKKNILSAGAKTMYWIGASDAETENQWQWVTSESFDYANWNSKEPSNASINHEPENYATIYRWSARWNDLQIDGDPPEYRTQSVLDNIGYICEWEPSAYFYN